MSLLSPEQSAGLFSRLYFTWVKPTLKEGMRRPLSVDTLLPLNAAEDPVRCDEEFVAAFEQHKHTARPILRSMWHIHRHTFWAVFVLSMLHMLASIASPLILRRLIQTISSQPVELAAALFVSALITSMSVHHMFHTLLKLMIRARIGLVATIYRKALLLTVASRQQAPAGQIINLMGTDAQKFVNCLNIIHSVWMHPMQFVIVLGVLYWILGPAALAGAAMLLGFLYLSALVARRQVVARRQLVRHSDERVGLMNEILMSMRVIKFYAWEASFMREVESIRAREVVELTKIARLSARGTLIFLSTPIVVAVVTFASFVLSGHDLNPADVFASLALFTVLRMAMVMLPDVVTLCLEANVSVRRIEEFLQLPELPARRASDLPSGSIHLHKAEVEWTPEHAALKDFNLEIRPGEFVAIVGPVGAGKSALMAAILGDLVVSSGRVEVAGAIAFVSQQAWILNDTVQNNILFGEAYNTQRYAQALRVSGLEQDLAGFQAGDQTEIGERGVNLSGGQRQRISLARAFYSTAPIVLLDDPLSALDNKVGQYVYEACLCEAMQGRTRVLTTHRLEYVERADRVLVMQDGKIVESGRPAELIRAAGAADGPFAKLWQAHLQGYVPSQPIATAEETPMQEVAALEPDIVTDDMHEDGALDSEGVAKPKLRLIADEERHVGVVGFSIYRLYWAVFAPGALGIGLALICVLKEVLNVGTDSWLAWWSTAGVFKLWLFLGGYLALGLVACGSTYLRSLVISLRGLAAGTQFHTRLVTAVARAPMGFFEGTPVGRVLNRFSRDMEAVDQQIPHSLHEALGCIFTILSTLGLIVFVTPMALIGIVPVAILYYLIQRYFRPASRESQRLDSITRSPIFAQFSESLAGVQVIRAFRSEQRFAQELLQHLRTNSRTFYTVVAANRWLGTRIETLGACVIAAAAFASVFTSDPKSAGFVGLSVTYALAITGAMNWAVRMFSQLESNMNSVERIDHYANLKSESWEGMAPPAAWPSRGEIVFDRLQLRYRPELPPVIHQLSCVLKPGEKIGVVGRTGAGKSSLLLGLFRILEASGGRILIDGVDIANLSLHDLRTSLAIIPQEPVLFRGSIRKNLDPFQQYSDADVWDALERAELKDIVARLPGELAAEVHEGGSNFSVGQRQLLCLARAVLKRSRILLMDEATASVDVETDHLIQLAIKTEFSHATVIIIAHRLGTVMECDRIMVLERGRIVEFDAPQVLRRKHAGAFAALLQEEQASV